MLAATILLATGLAGPPPELRYRRGTFRPAQAATLAAESPAGFVYAVAIARRPLGEGERAALAAAGAAVLDVIPPRGYRVRLRPEDAPAIRRLPFVAWLGTPPGTYKVDPRLDGAADAEIRVVLADGEAASRVTDLLAGHVRAAGPSGKDGAWRVVATLPGGTAGSLLRALSELPEVEAIEPARRFRFLNQDAVWVHQSFVGPSPQETPIFDKGIYGCGEIVAVADSAQDYDSCYFRETNNVAPPIATCSTPPCPVAAPAGSRRKDILYYNWSGGPIGEQDTCPTTTTGVSGHGTHTSGSVAGDSSPFADCSGFNGAGRNGGDGLAPGAKLVIQEMGDGLEYLNDLGGTFWNLADVAYQNGARIHSDSWGGACYDELGQCIPGCTAPYDSYSRDADLAMWTYPDLLVVTAAGNAGFFCPAPIAVGTPAIAKSTLTVGAVGHGSNATTPSDFSSPGPVEDGRLKPAVAAQGEATVSAASDANVGTSNCGTCSLDGSSMSAPTAAGLAALVREYYAKGFYATGARNPAQGLAPTGALVKATLVDAAFALGANDSDPDFASGFGRIELDRTLAFTGSPFKLRVDDRREGVVTGSVVTHAYDVLAGTPFRATLVWSDYPAALNAAATRVNELKLEVVDPSGTTWFQTIDGATGLPVKTSNGSLAHDGLNVEERLAFDTPAPGRWIVRVRGVSVAMGPQPFALVVRGNLTDCPAPSAPAAPSLATPADNQVQVTWSPVGGASSYNVYRSFGACPGGAYVAVATGLTATSFLDTTVSGGVTYSYVVVAASDAAGTCESPRSPCASVVPTGACTVPPSFQGVKTAASAGLSSCSVDLAWTPGAPFCAGDLRYNVYRGTTSSFVPGPANRIARCLSAPSFRDAVDLSYGATYWYVVRAEDASSGRGGPCRDGNEDGNTIRVSAAPDGPLAIGTWTDDAGDTGPAKLVPAAPWLAASSEGRTGPKVYKATSSSGICADLTTPAIPIADPGQGPQITFWTKHDLEYDPTGEIFGTEGSLGELEIATAPQFSNWTRVPLVPDYPNNVEFPYNQCTTTQVPTRYFTGNRLIYSTYSASLANWAGGDVKIRWHLSGDFIYSGGSWWVDDITIVKAYVPGSCSSLAAGPPPVPDGSSVPGSPLRASRSGTDVVVTWDATQCPATAINVYRGAIGAYGSFNAATCSLPPTGTATIAMPANVWFLAAATNGSNTDGSYGKSTTGAELNYTGAGTVCPGIVQHVTNNACP